MARTYKVIDADGHILEPVDIWEKYMDPAYRDRAPKIVIGDNGKERLLIEGQILGNPKGLGRLGGVGARDGSVDVDNMTYKDGRPGGFDPHARIKDMELDGIDAAFLYPSIGLFSGAVHDLPAGQGDDAGRERGNAGKKAVAAVRTLAEHGPALLRQGMDVTRRFERNRPARRYSTGQPR